MKQDIVIVGAGLVGLSLALALARQGVRTQLLDARPAPTGGEATASQQDKRTLALSVASAQTLAQLGAWPQYGITPIETIHISQRGGFGRTQLRHTDYKLPALGYVLPASQLLSSLKQACAQHEDAIQIRYASQVTKAQITDNSIVINLANATQCEARVMLCAEGKTDERVSVVRDYQQHAVLCHVRTESAHRFTAYERFTPEGPLALLPCGDEFALVWTVTPLRARQLLELDDATFIAQLQTAFGNRVQFRSIGPRVSFPLGLSYRRSPVGDRTVWVGNAAQTLHPVAGQGLNLALRDVMELAQCLQGVADPGATEVLQKYAGMRRLDRQGAIYFTDFLVRGFSSVNPFLNAARGLGLGALDLLPPLRHFVAKRMIYGARAW